MIDYKKLSLAHDLLEWVENGVFTHKKWNGNDEFVFWFPAGHGLSSDLDSIIAKMREVIEVQNSKKPEPKYKVWDKVWILEDNRPKSYVIDGISGGKYYLSHPFNQGLVCEQKLYPHKEALIDYQIEYWTKLKSDIDVNQVNVDVSECDHEHDGNSYVKTAVGFKIYTADGETNPDWHFKCKKCGEYYR